MFNLVNVAHAQTVSKVLRDNPTLRDLLAKITDAIITPVMTVVFVLAFFLFVWGIFGMITSEDDSEKRNNGKRSILWGTIGMAIMLSVYGIIRLIAATLGVPDPFL